MKKAALAGAAEGGTTRMNHPNTNEPAWQRLADTLPVTTPEGRTELANARRFATPNRLQQRVPAKMDIKVISGIEQRIDECLEDPGELFCDLDLLHDIAEVKEWDLVYYESLRLKLKDQGIPMRAFDRVIKEKARRRESKLAGELHPGGFFERDGCMCRAKSTNSGSTTVQLCNFVATITDEVVRDDGQERRVVIGIKGKLATGKDLARTEVSADDFQDLKWIIPAWGTDAIVWPGEHRALPAAIQAMSQTGKARRMVYTHTGWREDGDGWCYIHAGGAIGLPPGATPVSVDLQPPLTRFVLPTPPTGDAATAAVRASLRMLDLADRRITVPILAAVFRASLSGCDFGLHVAGPSGVYKSELAALAQQYYGPEMDARHLPGSWSSTANSLELAAFLAKDTLFVCDDFAPTGGSNDIGRLHREAERLFRAQGNQAGRQRMAQDGTLRHAKHPRGLILSTGEETPRGQSLRARLLILEVSPGDIDTSKLTECQHDAADGKYSQAMACFLAWLAPTYAEKRQSIGTETARLRTAAAADGMHARTPGIVASLMVGLETFFKFCEAIGAVTTKEHDTLSNDCWAALRDIAARQADKQQATEPAAQYLRLLASVLASHRAHVASVNGDAPDDAARWGWRRDGDAYRPQGRRIGWTDGSSLFLQPDSAYAEVAKLASDQDEALAVSSTTLRKRLKERGFLASQDTARQTLTVRRTLDGTVQSVLHLRSSVVGCDG